MLAVVGKYEYEESFRTDDAAKFGVESRHVRVGCLAPGLRISLPLVAHTSNTDGARNIGMPATCMFCSVFGWPTLLYAWILR